ncbi:MAG: hypothetical protein ACOX2E_00695 [Syntrophaceticus sp.]
MALNKWLPYISDLWPEKKQKRQKPDTVQDRDNGSAMRKGMSTIAFGSAQDDKVSAAHSTRGG